MPAGAISGKIKVTNSVFEAISEADFWITPVIASFSPEKAEEGAEVIIKGSNFSANANENIVSFGTGIATEVVVVSVSELKVKVPADATDGFIKVTVQGQEASTASQFLILPTLLSFTPDHGERGSVVTLTGKHFNSDAEVFLDDKKISSFEAGRSATNIQFKIPNDAIGAVLKIKQHGVEKSYSSSFKVTNIWLERNEGRNFTGTLEGITFVYKGKIYCGLGGNDGGSSSYFQIFDPASGLWSAGASIPNWGRLAGASAVMQNDKLYFGNGINELGYVTPQWSVFDPATGNYSSNIEWNCPKGNHYGSAFCTMGEYMPALETSTINTFMSLTIAAPTY